MIGTTLSSGEAIFSAVDELFCRIRKGYWLGNLALINKRWEMSINNGSRKNEGRARILVLRKQLDHIRAFDYYLIVLTILTDEL